MVLGVPFEIERARERVAGGIGMVRDQRALISDLEAQGRPTGKAHDLLQVLERAAAAFQQDLEFLERHCEEPRGAA